MKIKPTYKELEQELQALKTSQLLMEKGVIIHFIWKNEENWPIEYVSKNVKAVFGYSANDFLTKKITYSQLIHTDDLVRITQEVRKNSMAGVSSFEHQPYRIINKNGKTKWIKDVTLIHRNERNEASRFEGLILDVTDQINLEIELNKYATAVEQSANTIVITDTEGNIEYTNPQFTKVTGYSVNEVMGENLRFLNAGCLPKEYYANMWKTISSGETWKGEFCNKTKEGKLFWENVTITPIKDQNGKITNYLAIKENITEKKQAEEKLKKSEEKYRDLINASSDIIFRIGTDGYLQFINPAGLKLFVNPQKDIRQIHILDLVVPEQKAKVKEYFQTQVQSDKPLSRFAISKNGKTEINFEVQALTSDGKRVWLDQNVQLLKENCKLTGFLMFARDITQSKLLEQKLQQQNEELQIAKQNALENQNRLLTFINSIPDIVCYKDGNGRWLLANDANLELFGLKGVDYFGKTDAELAQFTDKIYQESFLTCMTTDKKAWEQKERSQAIEIIPKRKEGDKIYDVFKIPIFHSNGKRKGLAVIGRDITQQKQNEEKYYNLYNLLRIMTDTLPDMLWVKDLNGRYLFANKSYCKNLLNAADTREPVGKTDLFFAKRERASHPENPHYHTFGELCLDSDKVTLEAMKSMQFEEFGNVKGRFLMLDVNKAPLYDIQNNLIGVVGSARDITKLKEYEKQLIKAKEKAEESDKLKTEFLRNMSHEIRTPLNGILGFSELLEEENTTTEERKQYIGVIQNSGYQLLHIINDILEIARLETKQVRVIEKEVHLNNLFTDQFLIFDKKVKEKGLALYLKKELPDKDSIILTDKTKLNKILSNLLENALKFTNTGYVELGYSQTNDRLDIYVKDTGIGIKPQSRETIFERFSQEEKELSRNVGGLGLGLSIVKENTELLGGKITLESEKGKGSVFHVVIPYKPVNKKSVRLTGSNTKPEEKQKVYTILVVEDEEMNLFYIETLLKKYKKISCNTLQAHDGKEAVEICKNTPGIDLVLMDLKMPVMNGFKATKEIKRFRPDLPVIAQTAYSTPDDKKKALSEGCDDFISKPIQKENLKSLIFKYLNVDNLM